MRLKKIKHLDKNQVWMLILVWLLILSMPLFSGKYVDAVNWSHIFRIWKETGIVFIVFLVNRFFLLPHFFFKQKRIVYLLTMFVFIVSMSSLVFVFYQHPITEQKTPELHHEGIIEDGKINLHTQLPQGEALTQIQAKQKPPPKPPFENSPEMRFLDYNPLSNKKMPVPPFSNVFMMSLLIVGFDTGLVLYTKWNKTLQNKLETEKENVQTQMAFLKNQISPHFFMNTLNNIHALVDIDPNEAKNSIIWLSELMDYMLYESETDFISISKEIEFIESYIKLMKLRFSDNLDLKLEIPALLPKVEIPPLLIISFIENAFKYGIKPKSKSFIHIKIDLNEKEFIFKITNSIFTEAKSGGGIGISNTRKRLELIYGANYDLTINDNNIEFVVLLKIPV